jgi:hypothetical protein
MCDASLSSTVSPSGSPSETCAHRLDKDSASFGTGGGTGDDEYMVRYACRTPLR